MGVFPSASIVARNDLTVKKRSASFSMSAFASCVGANSAGAVLPVFVISVFELDEPLPDLLASSLIFEQPSVRARRIRNGIIGSFFIASSPFVHLISVQDSA